LLDYVADSTTQMTRFCYFFIEIVLSLLITIKRQFKINAQYINYLQ